MIWQQGELNIRRKRYVYVETEKQGVIDIERSRELSKYHYENNKQLIMNYIYIFTNILYPCIRLYNILVMLKSFLNNGMSYSIFALKLETNNA